MGIARALLGPSGFDEVELVRRSLPVRHGTMIDVGAHFGGTALPFAQAGWQVHAFEPDPANRARLERVAAGMGNITIVPCAVADTSGSLTLYTSDVSTGISALSAFHPSHRPTGEVPVVTLEDYFAENRIEAVDLLKVDTEGHDLFVLRGVPWPEVRPRTVVCEFEDRKTVPLGYSSRELADFLAGQGYEVLVSEWYPIVEYGRQHRWRRLLRWPCAMDPEAWGNMIAVPPSLVASVDRAAKVAAVRLRARRRIEAYCRAVGLQRHG